MIAPKTARFRRAQRDKFSGCWLLLFRLISHHIPQHFCDCRIRTQRQKDQKEIENGIFEQTHGISVTVTAPELPRTLHKDNTKHSKSTKER